MRQRTSVIWQLSREELVEIVKKSDSLSKVLNHFGLLCKGHNTKTLRRRLIEDNIDISHIPTGFTHNKNRVIPPRLEINEYIGRFCVENSTYGRNHLKERLMKEGILKNICAICGLSDTWNNKKIVMIIDHINGVSNDHRLENLRMVCPNCNSQLDTHCGKHKRKKKFLCACGREICKKSTTCTICRRKVERPPYEQLLKEIEETSIRATGIRYGVSSTTIKKWIKWEKI